MSGNSREAKTSRHSSDESMSALGTLAVDKPPTPTGSTAQSAAALSQPTSTPPDQHREPASFSLQRSLSEVKHPPLPATQCACEAIGRLSLLATSAEQHCQKLFLLISRARDIIDHINSSLTAVLSSEPETTDTELLDPFYQNMVLLDKIEDILCDVEAIPKTSFGQFNDFDLHSWISIRQSLIGHLRNLFSVDPPVDHLPACTPLIAVTILDDRSWIGTVAFHIRLHLTSLGSPPSSLQPTYETGGDSQVSPVMSAYEKFSKAGAMLSTSHEDHRLPEGVITLGTELYLLLGDRGSGLTEKWLKLHRNLNELLVRLDENGMSFEAQVKDECTPDTATAEDPSGHSLEQALSSLQLLSQHGPAERVTDPPESLTSPGRVSDSILHLDYGTAPRLLAQSAAMDRATFLGCDSTPSAEPSGDFDGGCSNSRLEIASSIRASDESREDDHEGDVRESNEASSTSVEPTHPDLPLAVLHVTGESERPPRLSPRGGRSTASHPSGSVRFIPAELWIIILKFLATERKALACLSQTCRTLYEIIIPFLWADVKRNLYKAPRAKAIACFEAINGNPSIARHVKRIWVRWLVEESLGSFVAALKACSNLQSLELVFTLFNPQLCEMLHELPSLRSLEISWPSFTTAACSTKLKPMPITNLELDLIQGWGLDFLCDLAAAPSLQFLQLDKSGFTPVMQMYTISGIPLNLSSLRVDTKLEHRPLLSTFLGMPRNPIQRISVSEAVEYGSKCNTVWAPLVNGPETLPRLQSVAGGINLVLHLVESVGSLERIVIKGWLNEANEFEEVLRRVKERNGDTLKTLVFWTEGVIETWFGMVSDAFPGLKELGVVHKGALTGDDVPIDAIKPFHRLQHATIIAQGPAREPSGRMSIPEGPLSWETACPELRQIEVADDWGWKRLEKGCWVKEELQYGWMKEVFDY